MMRLEDVMYDVDEERKSLRSLKARDMDGSTSAGLGHSRKVPSPSACPSSRKVLKVFRLLFDGQVC